MKSNKNIYHQIKPYKVKRLFFSKYWRSLYNAEGHLTVSQYEYKMATHCWLQRLNEQDIVAIIGGWYKKHGIQGNFWHLRHVVIPETYKWTLPTVKAQRKIENEKAKAKRLAAAEAGCAGRQQ